MKWMKRLLLLVLVLGASAAIGSLLLVAQQGGGTSLDSRLRRELRHRPLKTWRRCPRMRISG